MGEQTQRTSMAAWAGMYCALLSLASGVFALAVTFILWWRTSSIELRRLGQNIELFCAAVGLVLAWIAFTSPRKLVRVLGIVALLINVAIVALQLDLIFMFMR